MEIDQDQAAVILRETVGALSLFLAEDYIYDRLHDYVMERPDLAPHGEAIVGKGFGTIMASGLGTFVFVYPYERFKKILVRYPDERYDPSEAFGLDTQDIFEKEFPRSVVHVWGYDATNDKTSCFADCVRNSFAHAQSRFISEGRPTGVIELLNTRDGINPNFSVTMVSEDFWKLIQQALRSFLSEVVLPEPAGSDNFYPPLQRLLDRLPHAHPAGKLGTPWE